MRSELDVLLDKIEEPNLRAALRSQVEQLRARRTFGLVFESHLPERVRLPHHPVRVGVKVAHRDQPASPAYQVVGVKGKTATLRKVRHPDGSFLSAQETAAAGNETARLDSLVVIAEFERPFFRAAVAVLEQAELAGAFEPLVRTATFAVGVEATLGEDGRVWQPAKRRNRR
jgi:hypothetical protein